MATRRRWAGARFPPAADGLQLNACRNVLCANFGVPPSEQSGSTDDGLAHYRVIGTTRADKVAAPAIVCALCETSAVLISNAAVVEEMRRVEALTVPRPAYGRCRTQTCPNYARDAADTPEAYHRFGSTAAGSPRFRCRLCGSTFSRTTSPTHRLRNPHHNLPIFKALINKVPMRRLCDLMDVSAQTLYQRIGWIHERCREFTADHESSLWAGNCVRDRMHIAMDRQEHMLNSGSAVEKRPVMLQAVASAEAFSGYVLLQNINFDPDVDAFEIELAARECGDIDTPRPFRQYARLNLPFDDTTSAGPDEAAGHVVRSGMKVAEQISMAAHLAALRKMTNSTGYVQLSMDREPGLERLALLALAERVRVGTADAYFVRLAKVVTQADKRQRVADAAHQLAQAMGKRPGDTEAQVLFRMIEKRYSEAIRQFPEAKDRWIAHPFQTMGEPDRAVLCLTDDGGRPRSQIIRGLARASLRSIDRYFMQVRRKIHVLERPISTSSQANRRWYGYSAYNPVVVMRLLEIFRVVYNYHLIGKQDTTPAERLGLATKRYDLHEIIRA